MGGPGWWTVLLGVPLAVLAARTAFLGHDAGHRQIARSARANRWLGLLLGNLLLGMGHGWWNDKHNRHHANPNHVGKDPDVGEGVLAWTQEQAGRKRGVLRWVARHQAALFFPLLTLEGVNLKVGGLMFLRGRSRRDQLVEGGLLLVHAVGYLALAFALLPFGAGGGADRGAARAVRGASGCGVRAEPQGMAMPEPGAVGASAAAGFDVAERAGRGGHRLADGRAELPDRAPPVPGSAVPLRRVRPLVMEHCAAVGVPYAETGLVASYRQALGHMREIGEPVR